MAANVALFTIGKVTGVHGLNGNLKVWSYAESIDTFGTGQIVLLQSEEKPGTEYTILKASAQKKGLILSLEGVNTRDLAEKLIGYEILMNRDQLPDPEEDAWYWEDLIGLEVVDDTIGSIGHIVQIFPTGANDVLVVHNAEGKETLIPMHRNFVKEVDIEQQFLKTCLPEGYE